MLALSNYESVGTGSDEGEKYLRLYFIGFLRATFLNPHRHPPGNNCENYVISQLGILLTKGEEQDREDERLLHASALGPRASISKSGIKEQERPPSRRLMCRPFMTLTQKKQLPTLERF